MHRKILSLWALYLFNLNMQANAADELLMRSKRSITWNLPDQFFKSITMNSHSLCITQSKNDSFECFSLYSNPLKVPPIQQKVVGKFKNVTTAENHSCGLSIQNNAPYCWGKNENGQLATGDTEPSMIPLKIFTAAKFKEFALSSNNSYALDEEGKIWGWGSNQFGQLGYFNYNLNSFYPYQISNNEDLYFAISSGNDFVCGISREGLDKFGKYGKIYCLGKGYSQVETDETLLEIPNEFISLNENNYYYIKSAFTHTCAINKQRKIECWGENKFGQLGQNPTENSFTVRPILVTHPTDMEFNNSQFKSIMTTPNATCATTDTNKTYCFGDNTFGQLGYKLGNEAILEEQGFRYSIQYLPKELKKDSDVINKNYVSLAGNSRTLCGITQQQELECWGFSENNFYKALSVGDDFFCGLSLRGTRALCGSAKKSNDDNLTHPWNTTIQFPWVSKEELVQVSAGAFAVCGISDESAQNTYCAFNKKTPLFKDKFKFNKVNLALASSKIVVGDNHICAIQKQDGQVFCSGSNSNGQLGLGTFRSTKYAVEFKPIINPLKIAFKDLALSGRTTCALSVANEVYCFGSNEFGEMGTVLIASQNKTMLNKVRNLKLKTLVAGNKHFCGIILDDSPNINKVYCWGDNSFGQVGKQSTSDPFQSNNINTPVAIPNSENAISVTANEQTTCFLNKNGETFCLGKDLEKVLEQRPETYTPHLPYQVQKSMLFNSISLGKKMACGILKADKKIHCWGINN